MHNFYKPIENRFKDYVAIPKSNGYQALHTTLIALEGIPIEVQIQTKNMVEIAEDRGTISNVPIYERSDELNAITKISTDNNIPTYERNRQRQRNFR